MKQIKAREVKPGMEVEFTLTRRMKVYKNVEGDYSERELEDVSGSIVFVGADTPVTVLSEPAPPQPEEPTEFGAKARVRGRCFLRMGEVGVGRYVWFEKWSGSRWSWDDLCEMGPVTVIPDQGWTVPDDTPEVPERIDEWPEDDTALRPYPWRDREGDTWTWAKAQAEWECHDDRNDYLTAGRRPSPRFAPFTRVTDA